MTIIDVMIVKKYILLIYYNFKYELVITSPAVAGRSDLIIKPIQQIASPFHFSQ
ncbi:MAG: hypothetical protein MUC75_07995 [Ignavibacteriaceae bacterium]|nr:hypothetical protein [Ignavibacteriaceae bacterium]